MQNKIVKLSGGIGNQLFQYAFGLYLNKNFNFTVHYEFQKYKNHKNITDRNLQLNNLIKNISIKELGGQKLFFYRIKRKIVKIFPKFSNLLIEDDFFNYDLIKNKKYFDGYWQSLDYVKDVKNELKENINFNNQRLLSNSGNVKIIKSKPSCSLHIRRGDYLNSVNAKIYAICSLKYYLEAIDYVLQINKETIFYVFTDDINWAKNNFKGDRFKYLENIEKDPIVDLYYMSSCDHNIISNSTFSWWGAWLNFNIEKKIISPSKWYKNEEINNQFLKKIITNEFILF
jgi:hypothetical protein